MNLSAVSRRPGFMSQTPTSSLSLGEGLGDGREVHARARAHAHVHVLAAAPAAYALAANPTAATPAVFNRARRSIVDSLIYMSPTLVVTYDPPRRYLKFDQPRSSGAHAADYFCTHTSPRCTFVRLLLCLLATLVAAALSPTAAPIDRHALVTRHNPTITAIDKSAPFMVGNGNFAFTADITGLQTFPGAVFAAGAADDPGAVGLAQLSESAGLHARRRR